VLWTWWLTDYSQINTPCSFRELMRVGGDGNVCHNDLYMLFADVASECWWLVESSIGSVSSLLIV
jgi:hypothetical protein